MLSQKFWINYRPFTSVVLCTQTLHQQWLHTRTCYKNHRSATIMVISLNLSIGTSVSFWPKKVKCWNFEGDCVPNGSTGKVATRGALIYSWNMTFSHKMQNFLKKSSSSPYKVRAIPRTSYALCKPSTAQCTPYALCKPSTAQCTSYAPCKPRTAQCTSYAPCKPLYVHTKFRLPIPIIHSQITELGQSWHDINHPLWAHQWRMHATYTNNINVALTCIKWSSCGEYYHEQASNLLFYLMLQIDC